MTFLPAICTFYSFKGGVGRSMAALNVAYALVARGHRVLLVDFDLEAPGLSYFLQRQGEIGDRTSYRDAVDLLAWARQVAVENPEGAQDPDWVEANGPSLFRYVSVLAQDKLQPLLRPLGTLGTLHVLPADTERDYVSRLADLRLAELERDQLFAMSAALRGQFQRHRLPIGVPTYYGTHGELKVPYDFVLLDSRTGFNELGGLCVGPVADRLIVFTGLNDQNVAGTRLALETLGVLGQPDSPEPWDDMVPPPGDPFRPPFLGKKPTLLVASPVPVGVPEQLKPRMQVLQDTFGVPPAAQLSYHPQLALQERVFVRDYPDEQLSTQYVQLAERIEALLCLHPSQFKPAPAFERDPKQLIERLKDALRFVRQNPSAGLAALQFLLSQRHIPFPVVEEERHVLDQVFTALGRPEYVNPAWLHLWASFLLHWYNGADSSSHKALLRDAIEQKIAQALQLEPNGSTVTAPLHMLQGDLYLAAGEATRAVAEYSAWIDRLPGRQQLEALNQRARAHMQNADPERALQDLDAVLHRARAGHEVRFWALGNRALLYRQTGRLKEALADMNEALQLDGNDPAKRRVVLSRAIEIDAAQADLPNAQAHFAELERQPGLLPAERAAALANLGWCAYLLKRYEDAVMWSRQAVALHPTGPACVAQANLGLALLHLGRTAEAHEAYRAFADQCVIDAVLDAALKDLDEAVAAQADLAGVAEARELLLAQKRVVADLSRRATQAATLSPKT